MKRMAEEPGRALAQALARGDEQALRGLYEELAPDLYAYLLGRLRDPETAREVLQDVFLRVVRHRRRIARARSVRSYLFAMAANEVRRNRRRESRRRSAEEAFSARPGPAAPERGDVWEALAALAPEQAEAIHLHLRAGMTFAEVGAATGVSANTAASRYRYGIERLRRILGGPREADS